MNFSRPLILASKSPRRQQLLKDAGYRFTVRTKDIDESYPPDLPVNQVATYLADKKSAAFIPDLTDEIVITADTVVIVEDKILGKPTDYNDAVGMLHQLSGRDHKVMTGVCIADKSDQRLFEDTTSITFKTLTAEEINFYVERFKPYDKAGAYGIQEWMGMIAITQMKGSYFNVMGLPVHKIYENLNAMITAP